MDLFYFDEIFHSGTIFINIASNHGQILCTQYGRWIVLFALPALVTYFHKFRSIQFQCFIFVVIVFFVKVTNRLENAARISGCSFIWNDNRYCCIINLHSKFNFSGRIVLDFHWLRKWHQEWSIHFEQKWNIKNEKDEEWRQFNETIL